MKRSFGRVYSHRTLVFIGNGKGVGGRSKWILDQFIGFSWPHIHEQFIGWALARSAPFKINIAISKAIKQASRKLVHIELFEDRTIYQVIFLLIINLRKFFNKSNRTFSGSTGTHEYLRSARSQIVAWLRIQEFRRSARWVAERIVLWGNSFKENLHVFQNYYCFIYFQYQHFQNI